MEPGYDLLYYVLHLCPTSVILLHFNLSNVLFHRSGFSPPYIICQLCSKAYTDPRMLPCLHSFCGQCLHKEMERSVAKQNMACPTCQRSITISEGGVNALPQNLHLGFDVEVAGYISKISSGGEKVCDVCIDGDKGPAVVFCCTCRQFLCSVCHERNKIESYHQIVGLDQESVKLLPSIMTPTEHLCSQPHHEKKKLSFYCETCQSLVCKDCTQILHKDHKIGNVSTNAKVHRDRMNEACMHANKTASTLTSILGANDKMAEQVETSRENAILIVNQAFEQLHLDIEERKKAVLSEIGATSLSKTAALSLQKEQLVKMQDDIGRYTEMISHILETHTDHEVLALGDLPTSELNDTLMRVGGFPIISDPSNDIHVALKTESLMEDLSIFGLVMDPSKSTWSSKSAPKLNKVYSVEVETKSSEGERYPYGGLQVKAKLKSNSHGGSVVPGKVEDHGDGTYTITLTPQAAGPHQLLITMNDEHIQGSPHDLDVRHTYCTLRDSQQVFNCRGNPSGIAIHDSGDIYVACWNEDCIRVFDQGGHEKRTIGSIGSGDGQFNKPYGISIKGDVLYVADCGNNRIQKLTTGGQFLLMFVKYGSVRKQFSCPVAVIVDQRDKVIVAEYFNNSVVILDKNGNWLLTINGNSLGNKGFKNPLGLALDPQGNIHVAAYGSNTIKVFTPERTYVRSYGDVNGPTGIAIDNEGYSLICEWNGNCLSIFNPQGNKIHAVYDLIEPNAVALDHINCSLYVANRGVDMYTVL